MPGQSIAKIIKAIGFPGLVLLAAWGGAATLSLTLAVMALLSDTGSQRLARALSGTEQPHKEQQQTEQFQAQQLVRWQTEQLIKSEEIAREKVAEETGRLTETIRGLAADRDRLLARVTALEHSLEDVTGSIRRRPETPSPPPASPSRPAPSAAAPMNGPTALSTATAATVKPAAPIPPSASAPSSFDAPITVKPVTVIPADTATTGEAAPKPVGSVGTTTEFGVDIGGGATLSALRDLWSAARSNHGKTLEGLRPVISVHDGSKPGTIELRLIVGPLGNAGAAARICATLAASGWSCKPSLFDGQKLALR